MTGITNNFEKNDNFDLTLHKYGLHQKDVL